MKTLLDAGRLGERLDLHPFIDMHGHLGRIDFTIPSITAESLVRSMDSLGVEKICVSHMRCMDSEARWGNDRVAEDMRAFPGRIEGYVGLWPDTAARVKAEVERCLAVGFGGLKMHNANTVRYSDEAYRPAWQIAHERCLPVLLHTWGDEPAMSDIRSLAKDYPNAAILMAHSGSESVEKYIALARDCPHVYVELALSRGDRGLVERFVKEVSAEKVVFGSDALFFSLHHQVGKVLGASIDEAAKRLILGGNGERILARRRLA